MPKFAHRKQIKLALRPRLLGTTSLIALTLVLTDPLYAADQMPVKAPPAPTFYERFHMSLEGGYLWNRSPTNLNFDENFTENGVPALRPGRSGGFGGISFGGTMGPTRDWRVGWQGSFLGTNSATTQYFDSGTLVTVQASNKFWFQTFDAEMGFRAAPDSAIRWFLGARVLNARNTIEHSDSGGGKLGNFAHRTQLWGAGPRAGFEATTPLQAGPAFLTMSGSASAIFARRNHDFNFDFVNDPPAVALAEAGSGTRSFSRTVVVYNVEAFAALGYRLSNQSTFHVGYRVQQWWNIVPNITGATINDSVTVGNGRALVHGPFGRLTVAWPN